MKENETQFFPDFPAERIAQLQSQASRIESLAVVIQSLGEILTDDSSEFPDEDAQTFRLECRKKFLSLTSQLEKESQVVQDSLNQND